MAKQSQLEKAIAAVEGEIEVLQKTRERLVAQRPAKIEKTPVVEDHPSW